MQAVMRHRVGQMSPGSTGFMGAVLGRLLWLAAPLCCSLAQHAKKTTEDMGWDLSVLKQMSGSEMSACEGLGSAPNTAGLPTALEVLAPATCDELRSGPRAAGTAAFTSFCFPSLLPTSIPQHCVLQENPVATSALGVISGRPLTLASTGQSPRVLFIYGFLLWLYDGRTASEIKVGNQPVCVCPGHGILGPLLTYCKVNN